MSKAFDVLLFILFATATLFGSALIAAVVIKVIKELLF
jgi:hypothetical protein